MKPSIPTLMMAMMFFACETEKTDPPVAERTAMPMEYIYVTDTIIVDPEPRFDVADMDSLMKLNFRLPGISLENSVGLFDQFHYLASATGGENYFVKHATELTQTLIGIIDSNLADKTDLVFLIDNTGSMFDDVMNVQQGTDQILDHIRGRSDIRIAVSTYGDFNCDARWFQCMPFTEDFDTVKKYIHSITFSGGGDYPESLFDGAAKAMDSLAWRNEAGKMIIVIGDAPGLMPPFSTATMHSVVEQSKDHGVLMNYYPVIVAPFEGYAPADAPVDYVSTPLVSTVYPLPSTGQINFLMDEDAEYSWEVYTQHGVRVKQGTSHTQKLALDLTDQKDGVYVVRIVNEATRAYEEKKVIVVH